MGLTHFVPISLILRWGLTQVTLPTLTGLYRETTHDDHEQYGRSLYFCNCEHELWQCHNSVVYVAKGRIIETNCIVENTPPPHFALDVVHKMGGGRINGRLR